VADLVGLFGFVAVYALITSFHEHIIEIFQFLLADFALNAIFTEVLVSVNRILLNFKFSTNLMEHVFAFDARNSFIFKRLQAQSTWLACIAGPHVLNLIKVHLNTFIENFC